MSTQSAVVPFPVARSVPRPVEASDFLVAHRLGVRYGRRQALRDASLAVPRRSVTALIGPSGCGKTSFLNCINRMVDLIPCCTAEGDLRLEDTDLLDPRLDVVSLRRRVGMIFQRPNPFPFSVRRNLELPLREIGMKDREAQAEAIERCLKSVGLWSEVKDRLDHSALSLSGGQQQRLCIARALLLEPEILLMDEPCSALDPMSGLAVEDLIRCLKECCTIVIVTHNLAQAHRISDRCALFWLCDGAGRVIEEGPTEQLFEAPQAELTTAYVRGAIA
jgi:phosphate transport system ATP-binding protein